MKLCFYSLDTRGNDAEIVPAAIPHHTTRINDTAPATRWNYDILEAAGEERFREMVEEITAGCVALVQWVIHRWVRKSYPCLLLKC